jgi:hypothetical protein
VSARTSEVGIVVHAVGMDSALRGRNGYDIRGRCPSTWQTASTRSTRWSTSGQAQRVGGRPLPAVHAEQHGAHTGGLAGDQEVHTGRKRKQLVEARSSAVGVHRRGSGHLWLGLLFGHGLTVEAGKNALSKMTGLLRLDAGSASSSERLTNDNAARASAAAFNVWPSEYIGADLGTVGAGSLFKSTELRLELLGNIQGGHAPDGGELWGRRERWDDDARSLRPL